jgi:hypothetical protein
MKTILLLAALGQFQYAEASRTPVASRTVNAPGADVAPPLPPIVVKFNEDGATKADVAALAESIAALRKELVAMKAPPPSVPPKAPAKLPPPPARRRWELADDSGKRWWSHDPDTLIAHVARENRRLAAGPLHDLATPVYRASCEGGSCGIPGGSFARPLMGTPMSYGGFSGGCAGGSCR